MSIPVINMDNMLISGHQRVNILKALGRQDEEIDVRVPNRKLTDKEVEEANIRENKNLGEWDFDALANFDEDLLKGIGFGADELESIFQLDMKESEREKELENILEIIISCESEAEQEKVYNELSEKGYRCRILAL